MPKKKSGSQQLLQIFINFVLPIFVLTRLSSEAALGATRALLLALSFPILYELFNVYKNRKISIISIIAIGGIIVTGSLSLLNLSVELLALRRAVPYVFVAVVILGSHYLKKPLITKAIEQVFNMELVYSAAKKQKTIIKLQKVITTVSYFSAALFVCIALTSYFATRIVVTSATNTEAFNQEYAQLRIISFPALMVPLFLGIIIIIWFLVHNLEKVTGLDSEKFIHKK